MGKNYFSCVSLSVYLNFIDFTPGKALKLNLFFCASLVTRVRDPLTLVVLIKIGEGVYNLQLNGFSFNTHTKNADKLKATS